MVGVPHAAESDILLALARSRHENRAFILEWSTMVTQSSLVMIYGGYALCDAPPAASPSLGPATDWKTAVACSTAYALA